MSYLVGELVLDSGAKVVIRWPDKTETHAIYRDTIGYNHFFDSADGDREIRLSNHFMRLKGIYIREDEE